MLTCFNCHSPLTVAGSGIVCPNCGQVGQHNRDYLDFLGRSGYYWSEISKLESRRFLRVAEKNGFQTAINWLESIHPGMSEYILSYSRADWIYAAIDPSQCQSALDIGSGWGAITFALSRHLPQVWSVESVPSRLKFQALRAAQENRKNIQFVRTDWLKLPFAPNSFDLIVVNGVLEWIGLSDFSQNPTVLQKQFLARLYRLLKPGGCLYIGIENRFAFFYFLGALDHSSLPFTSMVPRRIADWLVRRFRKTNSEYVSDKRMSLEWPNYRTYTYTKWGYQKLLRQTGFSPLKFQWSLSYNSPTESGYFDDESFPFLLRHFKEQDFSLTISSKLATRYGPFLPGWIYRRLFPLIAPGFLIFAYKDFAPPCFESQLLAANPKATSFVRRSGTHGLYSHLNYFLLQDGQPHSVCKFPRFSSLSRQFDRTESLFLRHNELDVSRSTVSGRPVVCESFLPGHVCQTNSPTDNQAALNWLLDFQSHTASGAWTPASFSRYINRHTSVLKRLRLENFTLKFLQNQSFRYAALAGRFHLPRTAEHGDFVKTNLIIDPENRKTYVLDWEFYAPIGSPIFDFVWFIVNQARVGDFKQNFIGQGVYSDIMSQLIRAYCSHYRLPTSLLAQAVPFCLIRAVSRRVFDPSRRHLDTRPFLELLNLWPKIYSTASTWLSSI